MKKKLVLPLVFVAIAIVAVVALTMPAGAINKKIGGDELAKLKGEGALIVDVRTPSEFEGAHIPDAINAPIDSIQQSAATWDKNQAIVVYCATGARSANAAAYLAGQGFKKVYDLSGGIITWTGETVSGQASTTGSSGPIQTNGKPVFIDFSGST